MYRIRTTPEIVTTLFTDNATPDYIMNGLPKDCRFIRTDLVMSELNELLFVEFYFLEPTECLEFPFELKEIVPEFMHNYDGFEIREF